MPSKTEKKNKVPNKATCLAIENIVLEQCNLEIHRENAAKKGKINIAVELQQRIEESEGEEKNKLIGELNLILKGISDDENEDNFFCIETTHVAHYKRKENQPWKDYDIDNFAKTAMMIHICSYSREFINDLMLKANLPKITLPLIPIGAVELKKN